MPSDYCLQKTVHSSFFSLFSFFYPLLASGFCPMTGNYLHFIVPCHLDRDLFSGRREVSLFLLWGYRVMGIRHCDPAWLRAGSFCEEAISPYKEQIAALRPPSGRLARNDGCLVCRFEWASLRGAFATKQSYPCNWLIATFGNPFRLLLLRGRSFYWFRSKIYKQLLLFYWLLLTARPTLLIANWLLFIVKSRLPRCARLAAGQVCLSAELQRRYCVCRLWKRQFEWPAESRLYREQVWCFPVCFSIQ